MNRASGISGSVRHAPPAAPPLTVSHPSAVTVVSGGEHDVTFSITNNLSFAVQYVDQGPCSDGPSGTFLSQCHVTFPDSARDLRVSPFEHADVPLWKTPFRLEANA